MRQSVARLGVFYIAACEFVLGSVFAFYAVWIPIGAIFSKIPNTPRSIFFALVALSLFVGFAGICFLAGRALVHGIRWGWFCSLAIGIGVVMLSLWMIRVAMLPNQVGDSDEAGMMGIAMLVFALAGLGLLILPSVRGYVRSEA
jgi:hypothetical protein